MGVSSDRIVAAVPTFAVQFRLRDVQQNLPGSHIVQGPTHISHEQVFPVILLPHAIKIIGRNQNVTF